MLEWKTARQDAERGTFAPEDTATQARRKTRYKSRNRQKLGTRMDATQPEVLAALGGGDPGHKGVIRTLFQRLTLDFSHL